MITEPDGQWHFQSLRLFLSHTHQHRQTMADLKEALSVYAIDAFVAHNDIEPTAQWQEVIEQALRTGDALAAYVTSEFHSSSWTDQEVGAYVGRSKLVVPIRAGADPYGFIAKFQAVNANGKDSQTLAQELFQLLQTHHSTEALMAAPLWTNSRPQAAPKARGLT